MLSDLYSGGTCCRPGPGYGLTVCPNSIYGILLSTSRQGQYLQIVHDQIHSHSPIV